MEESEGVALHVINRAIVIVKMRQPFVDWLNQALALAPPMRLEDIQQDCTAFLVPDGLGGAEAILKSLAPIKHLLLELELESWTEDKDIWPAERGAEVADAWLSLEAHSTIYDTVDAPLEWAPELPPAYGTPGAPIYQIKVTLRGSKPSIWRRLLVRSDMTLAGLHEVIQEAMGWQNYHLHQFVADGISYGQPNPDFPDDMLDEQPVTLHDIAPGEGSRFDYEYDFGDSWWHRIRVEKVLAPVPGLEPPVCLTGRRACPPEDVGGIWGYLGFLEAVKNPEHPEHDSYLEWVGGGFDPEAFDAERVNQALRAWRGP
jgi:hypothetical protein